MNKRGQALIEALAAVGITTAFFVCAIGLSTRLVDEVQKEKEQLEAEICKMNLNRSSFCRSAKQKGFILISALMQTMLLLFCFQVIYLLIIYKNTEFESLSNCFEKSLQYLIANQAPYAAVLKAENTHLNNSVRSFAEIQTLLSDPIFEYNSKDKAQGKLVYNLNIKITPNNVFRFFKLKNSDFTYKCGAERECTNQNCRYSIVADKF